MDLDCQVYFVPKGDPPQLILKYTPVFQNTSSMTRRWCSLTLAAVAPVASGMLIVPVDGNW